MKLIPSFIEAHSPPGEQVLFASFERSNMDWTVLHSLDLAPSNNYRRTEIDFVIIIPETGILCIEVKSQKSIHFDGDRWQPASIKGSPFKQALDARYAFRRRLSDRFGNRFSGLPIMHCCIFPMSNFTIDHNLSIRAFEVLDKQDFERIHSADDFARKMAHNMALAIDQDPQVSKLKAPLPNEDVQDIVQFCYPMRKRKPDLSEETKRKQIELETNLVIQQKPILTLTELNKRVLVEGGAGTGKSLIGMEVARRKAQQGKRVAYLCFNKLIGKASEEALSDAELPNLVAGTVYSVLLKMTDIKVPKGADSIWWDQTSIELIEEKLTDPDFAGSLYFDYLVLDEAQDVLARPALWNCLISFLYKKLDEVEFLVLGDFVNQSLTEDISYMEVNFNMLNRISARWLLDENCRNYKQIGQVALSLSASDSETWSGYLRTGGTIENWSLKPYLNDDEQVTQIIEFIQHAKSEGFKEKDITILTFCAIGKSVLRKLINNNVVLAKAIDFDPVLISYSTINAFKGMENKVVIITDVVISPQNKERERKIFYTGMTRATEKLLVLCKKSTTKILLEWVKNGQN
jgi:hypothetical protein